MNKPFEFTEVDLSAVSLAATTDWANLGGAFRGTPQQIFYGGSMKSESYSDIIPLDFISINPMEAR